MKVIDLIIMKINEEKMPKHVLINRMNYYYDDEIESYRDEEGSRMVLDFTSNVFSMPVKIIEDEFIDIEKFKEHKLINTKDILELEMLINKINADYNYKINGLIKNQKKIIERLDKSE